MFLKKPVSILACLFCASSPSMASAESLHPLEQAEKGEFASTSQLAIAFGAKAAMSKLRGTHSKGTCVRGEMNFKDLKVDENSGLTPEVLEQLRVGLFGHMGSYPAKVRFANAEGATQDDHVYDARAVTISLNLGGGRKQDFVLQNSPVFPTPSLKDFVLLVNFVRKEKDLSKFTPAEQERIKYMQAKGKTFTADPKSYRTETYWSGTAFALGNESAAKYIIKPCETNFQSPAPSPQNSSPNFLSEDLASGLAAGGENCFDFRVQILKAEAMRLNGKFILPQRWVEDPTLVWNEQEAPSYSVGKLHLAHGQPMPPEMCTERASVTANTLPEHRPIGRINRGRGMPEAASAKARGITKYFGKAAPAAAAPAPAPAPAPQSSETGNAYPAQ